METLAVYSDSAASASCPSTAGPKRKRMDTRGAGDRGGVVALLRHCSTPISSSSSSSSSPVNLPDSLLEEILLRLPTAKSAVRCKVVSKHWYSLISSPDFPTRFINAHVNKTIPPHHLYCTIVCNFRSQDKDVRNSILMMGTFTDPHFDSEEHHPPPGFSLTCLPEEPSRVSVLASYNDLLLCLAPHRTVACDKYYACNPFTRQWIILSSCNAKKYHFERGTDFGIICDPAFGDNSRFPSTVMVICVAQIDNSRERLSVRKYCADNSRWSQSECLIGKHFQRYSNMVAYRGKFHWFNGNDKIVTYDPFNNGATAFICCAQLKSAASNSLNIGASRSFGYCLGVCQGFIRAMQLLRNRNDNSRYTLRIWELEDYEQGKWVLEHSVHFKEMVAEIAWVQELPNKTFLFARPLAFHPILKHIVYLSMNNHILSYNKHTKELTPEGEFLPNGLLFTCQCTFPLVIPLWPSPVSVFRWE